MATIFVARSANLCQWGSDVGLGKHLFKVGLCEDDPAPLLAEGFAGEKDWVLIKKQAEIDLTQEQALEQLSKRAKRVDPTYYPRIKGDEGMFKVAEADVHRHIVLGRALAGESERAAIKLKVADYATYLISNALR